METREITCRFLKQIVKPASSEWSVCMYTTRLDGSLPEEVRKSAKGTTALFQAEGKALPQEPRMDLVLYGTWKQSKYGLRFSVSGSTVRIPSTEEEIERFLASGAVKGIGKVAAKRAVERFGKDTLKIISENPERLLEVRGIYADRLEKIKQSCGLKLGFQSLQGLLAPAGFSTDRVMAAYRHFGDNGADILKENPYRLMEIAPFRQADLLAGTLGVGVSSILRCCAGLEAVLRQECQKNGDSYLVRDILLTLTSDMLNEGFDRKVVTVGLLDEAFDISVKAGRLIYRFRDSYRLVYLPEYDSAEYGIACAVAGLAGRKTDERLKKSVAKWLEKNRNLTEGQERALRTLPESRLMVITGGAGTGKTTVAKAVIDAYRDAYPDRAVTLLAPTGKAARRLEESTGLYASTIHAALRMDTGEGMLTRNAEIGEGLIIADEFSMADLFVAQQLFSAVPKNSVLVLMGDANQLPSVGPGAVLSDLIRSGAVPVACLTEIMRQDADSSIIGNSRKVTEGRSDFTYDGNFRFLGTARPDARERVLEAYAEETSLYGAENVAILSPFRKNGDTCTRELNRAVQEMVNGSETDECTAYGTRYRKGDRVIQTRNTETASNGDTGRILSITQGTDDDGKPQTWFEIAFDGGTAVKYTVKDMQDMDLAYALTVHKAQGSEYRAVIIPLPAAGNSPLYNRELLYTAVSRAREHVLIIGDAGAVRTCCTNVAARRNNTLAHRIYAAGNGS